MLADCCRLIVPLAQNDYGFVNKYPYKPASEAAFIIESRNIYRGGKKTVLHGILSFLGMAQDAACNEVE